MTKPGRAEWAHRRPRVPNEPDVELRLSTMASDGTDLQPVAHRPATIPVRGRSFTGWSGRGRKDGRDRKPRGGILGSPPARADVSDTEAHEMREGPPRPGPYRVARLHDRRRSARVKGYVLATGGR
jgi:hypothetical protein